MLCPVAFIADIEKAFLMISVNPDDREVLRFLWDLPEWYLAYQPVPFSSMLLLSTTLKSTKSLILKL